MRTRFYHEDGRCFARKIPARLVPRLLLSFTLSVDVVLRRLCTFGLAMIGEAETILG